MKKISKDDFLKIVNGITEDQPEFDQSEEHEDLLIKFILVLVRYFNRDKLDPITLWRKTSDAIDVALSQTKMGDIIHLFEIAFRELLVEVDRVISDPDYIHVVDFYRKNMKKQKTLEDIFAYLKEYKIYLISATKIQWESEKSMRKGK